MEDGRTALLFLYGLFWAETLGTSGRFHGFPTGALWAGDDPAGRTKQWKRFALSIVLLNVLPTVWLGVLYAWVVPADQGVIPVCIAAIASLSVFGLIRIYHGFVASAESIHTFYTSDELSRFSDIQGQGKARGRWSRIGPGLLYLLLYPMAALVMGWLR